MRTHRLFVSLPLSPHLELQLPPEAAQRVLRVLRLQVGDQVHLFNAQQVGEYGATIFKIMGNNVIVQLAEFIPTQHEAPLRISLYQGIPKGDKMDFIVQKAVELGVYAIVPLFTEHGNVYLEGTRLAKKIDRWQSIAISATEQCGRSLVPTVRPAQCLQEVLKNLQQGTRLILEPSSSRGLNELGAVTSEELAILIGAEGGFSPQELSLAASHGFQSLRLGPRILRTETASVAVLSALQMRYGDLA